MKLTLAFLLILALVIFPACTQVPEAPPDSTPPPDTTHEEAEVPPPTEPPPATTEEEAPPAITEEDVEAARQVVFAYLEALNSYDVEGTLAFLEESWREERAESITSEIGQMETLGITLGVEEEAEPVITPEGTIQIKIKLDIPVPIMPDRHVTYHLTKINDEWKIYFVEE